jgi:hypothetical protein
MIFITGLFAKWGLGWLLNGFVTVLEVLWRVLKFRIGLPFGVILVACIAAWYWQSSSVVRAVRAEVARITAKAELDAKDAIIKNNEILISEREKELREKNELLEIERALNEQYEQSVIETKLELEKMEKELEDVRKNPPIGDSVAPDSFINGLRN